MPSLMIAIRDTFYTLPNGQHDVSAMRREWPQLTAEDKADLKRWFEAEGVKIDE